MSDFPFSPVTALRHLEDWHGHVVDAGEPQADGTVRFRYGIDDHGRPTYTDAGTDDAPAYLTVADGRFHLTEIGLQNG